MKFTIVFVFCLRCTIKIIGNYTRLIVCSRRPRFVIFFAKRFSKLFTKIISYYILSSKKLNKLKNYLIIEFEHEKDAIIANFFLNSLKIDELFLDVKLYKKKNLSVVQNTFLIQKKYFILRQTIITLKISLGHCLRKSKILNIFLYKTMQIY